MVSLLDSIVQDLRDLPPSKLVEVSSFIHRLHPSPEAMERRRAALHATAGCMDGEQGEDFERAVRETADQIDADEQ
jgi:hypothetical protein